MSINVTKNKWLKTRKISEVLREVDDMLMEGWVNEMTLGEVLDSLPQELRDFILNMQYNIPDISENTIQLSLDLPE
jgi:hypothetical protein